MQEVVVEHISKKYPKEKVLAVNDVSFSVSKGELFGLIGPDGAGKTSIFRILTTLQLPDSGSASIQGLDVVKDFKEVRLIIGYMPGKFSLYEDLSVYENLNFFATLYNTSIEENYHIIKDIYEQIKEFKNRRAGKLSGGMKQKLALSCTLVHNPSVLFLDEPTTGVDAVSRKEFWNILKLLKKEGVTIIVSTPYMDEANLCDRIALMQKGSFLDIDTPEGIVGKFQGKLYEIKSADMFRLLKYLQSKSYVKSCHTFGETHHMAFENDEAFRREEFLHELKQNNFNDIVLNEIKPDVEDCFMQMMNQDDEQ